MATPLNVLIVEDSQDDTDIIVRQLRRAGYDPIWKRVDNRQDFLSEMQKRPDIILSDYSMPQFTGMEAVKLLRGIGLSIPFILISGTMGEEVAVEVMKQGVTDYLLKDRIGRLGLAVQRALEEAKIRAERHRLEAQFIEAQKMEVIGQLAGGVAHDFNNILAVIMGYSDLIMQKLPPADPLRSYLTEIQHASGRATGLTRQLLVFSRKQTVQPIVLDLNDELNNLEKMLRRLVDEHIIFAITPGQDLGRIKADPGYIGQVLMNLVVNARDAMPNGGRLSVATKNITLDDAYARQHEGVVPGEYVMVSVSDTGTGITDEVKARMFEAFFTTKPKGKGTGLGLLTCQTIVQQCGGHIGVYSELGKGSTFKVYLPRVDQSLSPDTKFLKAGPLPRGTETLIFVEDEPAVRHLACDVLTAHGYTVLSASNGQDALRQVKEHKGAPIRLVISDVIMPVMGGKVMAEWLKTTNPDLKILFTSGYTDDAIAHHGVLDSETEFLAKPYTLATLVRKTRELLDASS
jgi:two-component system cell cycle sensor histidine kinase/response regulator CckA